jgi:hypothetical protein
MASKYVPLGVALQLWWHSGSSPFLLLTFSCLLAVFKQCCEGLSCLPGSLDSSAESTSQEHGHSEDHRNWLFKCRPKIIKEEVWHFTNS